MSFSSKGLKQKEVKFVLLRNNASNAEERDTPAMKSVCGDANFRRNGKAGAYMHYNASSVSPR
jgi:hypothetical protein